MTFRFVEADEKFIEELKNTTENKTQWAKTRGKNEQLESCEVPQLNEATTQCFTELTKGSKW